MKNRFDSPIVVIGMGELGSVFARGFLRCGYPVYPITRSTQIGPALNRVPNPQFILVAVGEKDLAPVLGTLAPHQRERIGLLQNELLPDTWERYELENPTVISVWFEKKKGRDYKVLLPSPIYGPMADLVAEALSSLDIDNYTLDSADQLLFELVAKNVFVLTINICGLKVGGATGELWAKHFDLLSSVADEVISLQEWLAGNPLMHASMHDQLLEKVKAGIMGDVDHRCRGRSAAGRLARLIALGDQAGLKIPFIRRIEAETR